MQDQEEKNTFLNKLFLGFAVAAVVVCFVYYQFYYAVSIDYPLRAPRVKVGDWFLFSFENRKILETATKVEKTGSGMSIEYRIDFYDEEGKVIESKTLTHLESQEKKNRDDMHRLLVKRPEIISQSGLKKEKITVSIGGKNVAVTAISTASPNQETWYSDECSINGRVGVKMNGAFVVEPLDFGSASGNE